MSCVHCCPLSCLHSGQSSSTIGLSQQHTYCVVERFDAICIRIRIVLPRFGSKECVIGVEGKQIVKTIHKGDPIVVEDRPDMVSLADCTSHPACRMAFRLIPLRKLQSNQYLSRKWSDVAHWIEVHVAPDEPMELVRVERIIDCPSSIRHRNSDSRATDATWPDAFTICWLRCPVPVRHPPIERCGCIATSNRSCWKLVHCIDDMLEQDLFIERKVWAVPGKEKVG